MTEETLDLWLPCTLDPATLPGNGERPARIAYLAHLLTVKPYDSSGYVRLNKMLLQKTISWKAEVLAFQYLKPHIETDGIYSPGKHSKGYRWGKPYYGQSAIRHPFKCHRLAERLRMIDAETRSTYTDIERALDADLENVTLPINLDKFLRTLPPKESVKSEQHRRNVIHASGYDIQKGRSAIVSTSERTGRVHNSINRLSSRLREHLELCGEPVLEIDLASSQPFFLATLFPSLALRDAVSCGEFYSRVNEQLASPVDFSDREAYAAFKTSILAILYARPIHGYDYTQSLNWRHRDSLVAIEKAYPGIISFIEKYRSCHGDTALPVALQRLESSVFIDGALMTLQGMGIPAVPIHDSILCRVRDAGIVEGIIYDKLLETTQLEPTLNKSKIA